MNKDTVFLLDDSSSESDLFSCSSTSGSESDIFPKIPRVETFVEVVAEYTDVEFKEHFRVSRKVAQRLIEKYKSNINLDTERKLVLGSENEIILTLWFFANTETYQQICDRFNVTKTAVCHALHRVIKYLVKESYNYIKWPTLLEMTENQEKFANMTSFPRVVGVIDAYHIRVCRPKDNTKAYERRKGIYSILLQAIVDPEKKFIDIHCGEPGSMTDAWLFKNSDFYHQIIKTPEIMIPNGAILGDLAYADSEYVVTPFKNTGALTPKQHVYNYLHLATKTTVDNAFSLLMRRFRRLKFFESRDLVFLVNCVVVACAIHNICISENDLEVPHDTEEFIEEKQNDDMPDHNNRLRQEIFSQLDNEGILDRYF